MVNFFRALVGLVILAASGCGPRMAPTTVPPPLDPALVPFQKALQAYVDQTQPYRKQAAQAAEQVPGKTDAAVGAEASVRARQNVLADALKRKVRPTAKQGDLLVAEAAAAIRQHIETAFASLRQDLLRDALGEQNEAGRANTQSITINEHLDAPRLPPLLLELLPQLPKQLEYDFAGRTIVLRDVDADVVVDFLPEALPTAAPAEVPAVSPAPATGAAVSLPLPGIRGSTIFAAIGDGGTGDTAQLQVAAAMLDYFTEVRRFPFVIMLGDNLYDHDYDGQFSIPYKPLLDRGVKFYAALGNHDRDLEIHFKPFNMQDRDYYSFDKGNVRFAALNSNHPSDPGQAKWLDTVFANSGTKWRICFFHHPLYSSGPHAEESRDVIRPAMEPMLLRNRVEVVFGGHEHLYQRIAPQKGIRYFVSGGGGRRLYSVRRNSFDEVAVSEHHFMIVEIAGDRLFFEAVGLNRRVLDCGVIWRTPDAETKADADTKQWLASCRQALGPER
jgi:hypothetical protein